MLIKNKVRKISRYLTDILDDEQFIVGVQINSDDLSHCFNIVETSQQSVTVYTPKLQNGINAVRNTIGEFKINKAKPKEESFQIHPWHLQDWGGNWHDGISYISYERYARDFIEPKNIKFIFSRLKSGQSILTANLVFKKNSLNEKKLSQVKFIVNLLVEALGKAEIFTLDSITGMPIRKIKTINWKILPKGDRIWDFVKHGVSHVSNSEKTMLQQRLKVLESYFPDEIYKGIDSYTGYLVFYFKRLNLYVFDSIVYGNATYIFTGDWEKISKLTKKQIVDNQIAQERIIHNDSWNLKIAKLLK